ncbi:MAG: acyltransferase family protein [Spirochaetes bacterium]|nr:acyltransferase family protein [Spirochaetota bacterium]
METKNAFTNRVTFLDNLRTLMVLLVLIFHSGASYSFVPFWPFHDANPSSAIYGFMGLIDNFAMAILFFIAGYFALQSMQKGNPWHFIKGKLMRLGLPWLIITIVLLPMLDYLHYWNTSVNQGLQVRGYAEHWFLSMIEIAGFTVGRMKMSEYLDMSVHFYQRYMWFVSLLFAFFMAFALLYTAKNKLIGVHERPANDKTASNKSVFFSLALTGILTILLFALARIFIFSDFMDMLNGWFSLGNIIQFQTGKLIIYACFFALGVFGYSENWFTDYNEFGRPWIWGLACFLLFGLIGFVAMHKTETVSMGYLAAIIVLYPLWTLSFLGLFISFALRHWNRSTLLNRDLADNSYNMYLIHYIIPMTLPLLLSIWGGPVFVKFGIVAAVTLALSYCVSRYVLKPYPRAVVIGLVGLSVILALVM